MIANSRGSTLLVVLLVALCGCRFAVELDNPVPTVADSTLEALLAAPSSASAVIDATEDLVGVEHAETIAEDWVALVGRHGRLARGREVVIVSEGVTSANLDVTADGDPVGRLRVVVGLDGEIRDAAILRAWPEEV